MGISLWDGMKREWRRLFSRKGRKAPARLGRSDEPSRSSPEMFLRQQRNNATREAGKREGYRLMGTKKGVAGKQPLFNKSYPILFFNNEVEHFVFCATAEVEHIHAVCKGSAE